MTVGNNMFVANVSGTAVKFEKTNKEDQSRA